MTGEAPKAEQGFVVVERFAELLPGGRAQLMETLWEIDRPGGELKQVYSIRRGSPASAATVRREVETLTMDDDGVHRSRREV